VLIKQPCLSGDYFTAVAYLTEESVVLFQGRGLLEDNGGIFIVQIRKAFSDST
jgi:hypothetical protein